MLAQNFMTADELGVNGLELRSLITVLGMLERGELRDVKSNEPHDSGFNIGCQGKGCGTPACIGGWVARLMSIEEMKYVDSYMPPPPWEKREVKPLTALYWEYPDSVGVSESAIALRSFLTTGNPRWDLAVSS